MRRPAIDLDIKRIFFIGIEIGWFEENVVNVGLTVGRLQFHELRLLEAEFLDPVDVRRGQRPDGIKGVS